jgi:hypothetical protein
MHNLKVWFQNTACTSFWHVTTCNLTDVHWRFGGTYYFHLQGQRESQASYEWIPILIGQTIAHVVRCWFLATEFCFQPQVTWCKSRDGWNGIQANVSASFFSFLPTRQHLTTALHSSATTPWGVWQPWPDRTLSHPWLISWGSSHLFLGWLQSEGVNLFLIVSIALWFSHLCLGLPSSLMPWGI